MDLDKLDEPFAADDIEWRVQQCGVSGQGKPWAMVLAYVTNRAIMKRLDEVCGKAGWRNEFQKAPDSGVMCGISIKVDGEWITKWDAAENTQVEAVKGGMSSAMKRAAVQWGVGRYLYMLEEGFAETSLDKMNGWNRAKAKDGKLIFWSPPKLPSWALPPNKQVEPQIESDPEQTLKNFTVQAADCQSLNELSEIYKSAWNDLANFPEYQHKAKEVWNTRGPELKKAA